MATPPRDSPSAPARALPPPPPAAPSPPPRPRPAHAACPRPPSAVPRTPQVPLHPPVRPVTWPRALEIQWTWADFGGFVTFVRNGGLGPGQGGVTPQSPVNASHPRRPSRHISTICRRPNAPGEGMNVALCTKECARCHV